MKVLLVSFFIVLLDQLSKILVKGFSVSFLNFQHKGMSQGQKLPIISDFFNITYVENPGIAFGIDPGSEFKIFVSLITLAATLGLIIYFFHIKGKPFSYRLSIAFIIGGAAGNLIDRLFYGVIYNYAPLFHGKVVDFFEFKFFDMILINRTIGNYIFNVADIAVTVGILLLLIVYKKKEKILPGEIPV